MLAKRSVRIAEGAEPANCEVVLRLPLTAEYGAISSATLLFQLNDTAFIERVGTPKLNEAAADRESFR